uniref:RHS repeat-associated core domain-containing protein n=1 Tax=Pseudomonas ovata TaxID=1839709 RepID=UPI00137B2A5E
SLSGYNGEMLDSATGWYLLGKGYRAYDPALMRFHSPDSLSPFGSGGLNPYTYCLGNPIALHDPTGHFASSTSSRTRIRHDDVGPEESKGGGFPWLMAVMGAVMVAISVAAVVGSLGAAFPAMIGATGAVAKLAASTAGIMLTTLSVGAKTAGVAAIAGVTAGVVSAPVIGSVSAVVNASAQSVSLGLSSTTMAARTAGKQGTVIDTLEYIDYAVTPLTLTDLIVSMAKKASTLTTKNSLPALSNIVQGTKSSVKGLFASERSSAGITVSKPIVRRASVSSISDSLSEPLPGSRRSSVAESSTGSAHPAIPESPAEAVPNQTVRGQA